MNEIHDIIYVKTDDYSASHNQEIAWEIEKLNQQFLDEGRNYVLVGPGRWGSSDTWLGIPVKWPHISAARSRTDQLPGRPQPGNPLLPEPDLLWSGILYHQRLYE